MKKKNETEARPEAKAKAKNPKYFVVGIDS